MIIEKITVVNFGILQDFEVYPGDGMNVIYAPNESGKSTLLAFLKFMFYGSRQKKEPGELTFKDKYMPWNGMPMSGSIEFSHLGKKYYIYRSEGMKNGGKIYEIKNPVTGEAYEGIDNPGKFFFSVGERGFSQSCFVTDSAIITEADGDVISALSGNGTESVSYQKVREILDEKLLNLVSPKRSGSVYSQIKSETENLQTKLFQCEKELNALDSVAQKEMDLHKELEKTEEELEVLLKRSETSEKEKSLLRLRSLESTLKEESDDLERLMESRKALDTPSMEYHLSDEEREILQTSDTVYDRELSRLNKSKTVLLIMALICGFLCLKFCGIFGNEATMWAIPFLAFFFAAFLIGFFVVRLCRHKLLIIRDGFLARKKQINMMIPSYSSNAPVHIEEMKKTLSLQIEKSKTRIMNISDKVYELRNELSDIVFTDDKDIFDTNSFTNEDLSGIIKNKQKHIDDIKGALLRISADADRRTQLHIKAESLRSELKKLSDEHQRSREKAEVLKIAVSILDSAFSELRDNFAPALSANAFEIFSAVAGDRYDGIVTNEKFETALRLSNEYKDVRFLSAGTRELVYLSLRIAESAYFASDSVPVFLDDIMMSFDDERCIKMLKFLWGVSESRQIFLCTCRSREKDWCIEETNAVIIEL